MQSIIHSNAIRDTTDLYDVLFSHSQQISTRIMGKCANVLIKTVVCHPLGKNRWRWVYRYICHLSTTNTIIKTFRHKYSHQIYIIFVFRSSRWQAICVHSFQVGIRRRYAVYTNWMWWIWIENGLFKLRHLNWRTWCHYRWCCTVWCSIRCTTGDTVTQNECQYVVLAFRLVVRELDINNNGNRNKSKTRICRFGTSRDFNVKIYTILVRATGWCKFLSI